MSIAAIILADHRENNGAIPHLPQIISKNNTSSIKMSPTVGGGEIQYNVLNNETIGDYAILLPDKVNPGKYIIAAVFERKTWKDLAGSIKDGRCDSQFKNMLDIRTSPECFVYYIIEGNMGYSEDTKICRIPFKALQTKVRTMSLRGVHSFRTKNPMDTALFLVKMSRDLRRLYIKDEISFVKQENQNLTDESDSIIPTVLTTRIVKTETDILTRMWCCLPNVSPQLAPMMIDKFSIGRFICTVSGHAHYEHGDMTHNTAPDDTDPNEIHQLISNMTYSSGTRVGPVRSKKIIDSLQHKDKIMPMCCNILAEIPNMTAQKAEFILDRIDYLDLFSGMLMEKDLSEIKIKNNRNLGLALSKKILSFFNSHDHEAI